MRQSTIDYQYVGGGLLRATTDPGCLDLPLGLSVDGSQAAGDGARTWLAGIWGRAEVREALEVASPVLCRQVEQVLAGERPDRRRERKTMLSVASYLLRWQHRPTPFGLFAGVAPARVGGEAKVSWGPRHAVQVRADADWLTDIVLRLQGCRGLLECLTVTANETGYVRGDRFVLPGVAADGRARLMAPVEVSLRYSRPVAAALEAARAPISLGELAALLVDRFPDAPRERIDALLDGLIQQQALLTSLWAPMTTLDALAHVCAELRRASAEWIPGIADLARELYAIHADLAEPGNPAPWRRQVVERMRLLSAVAPMPLQVDTGLDADVVIPDEVAREAAEAVSVLHRLTPYPFGYPQWRDLHSRFRRRYGAGAVVPVLDLVADSGLGFPADYLGSPRRRTPRQLTDRDEKILALLQDTLIAGREEIVLTDQLIDSLAADEEDVLPVPRAEVAFEIHAANAEALGRGDFRLMITGTPRPGSSMAGRFAHLLPDVHREQLAAGYQTPDPGAIAAQLSFAPRKRRNENVARTLQLLPHVIPLGEHRAPDKGVIPLADLAVTADARRMWLVQLSTGRRVEPRVTHALEAGIHTPPLARFLAEVTTSRCAVYKHFDFGAAHRLPYLPRVRYRRTILAPARWLLAADDLPGRTATAAAWEAAFTALRTRLRVPDHVALIEHDQRLALDLTHPVHRLLLRSRLDSTRRLELREAPKSGHGWIGRAHEVLLPLTLTEPAPAPAPTFRSPRAVGIDEEELPGRADVLRAHIHGHPERQDEILIHHLPRLLAGLETTFGVRLPWWFTRHRDTARPDADQYLDLCLALPRPTAYGLAAEQLADWASLLRDQHLVPQAILPPYQPQTGRYGRGQALGAAQEVFAADSAAALAQIRATQHDVHGQALAAASLLDLATRYAETSEQAAHWLLDHLPRERGRLDPVVRDQALDLTDPADPGARLRALPYGRDVAEAWQARARALDAYRRSLAEQRNPQSALRSLLHHHHVRALGVDPDRERTTGRLVRACALRNLASRTPTWP